jgi:hypothetical protein
MSLADDYRQNAAECQEQAAKCQNPTEWEPIRRLPSGQLLRAAVAEELRHRRSRVPNRKAAAASPSARTGGRGDQEFAARRSAPARPAIKSPISQPEMPERTHATATLGRRFRSGREAAYPTAPRRRRRTKPLAEGAALARARKRKAHR